MACHRLIAAAAAAVTVPTLARSGSNATSCREGAVCEEDGTGMLQVRESWRCAGEGDDPYPSSRGVCCNGLTKVQGQFQSEQCTHQCFKCTGRNGNKDPFSQCGGSCDQHSCKVPCCSGTYEIMGQWNSEKCSYQCMCAGYGQDTRQYCQGDNPCGGRCSVPCCWPLVAVEVDGKELCWHWGQGLTHKRSVASTAAAAVEAAAREAEVAPPTGSRAAGTELADLEAKAAAAAREAELFEKDGPPRDPLAVEAEAVQAVAKED